MWWRPSQHTIDDSVHPLTSNSAWARRRFALYIALALLFILGFTFLMLLLLSRMETYFQRSLVGLDYYAYAVVFLVTLVGSASVVLPMPGLALVLAAATLYNPLWVALFASVGSTLGEVTAYALGAWGGKALLHRRRPQLYHRAEAWARRYGLGAVFFFALVPLMVFDLVGIAAGALRLPLWQFFLAVWAARLPRSFIEVYSGGHFFNWLLAFFD